MIKNKIIIFDFADTIAKLSPSKEELLQQFLSEEAKIDISIEKVTEVYHYATNLLFYSSVNIKDLQSKKEFYIEFNKNILSLLGVAHKVNAESIFEYFSQSRQHWKLKEGVIEMLEVLQNQNYLISLLSNFDTKLYEILEEMKIARYFDSVFISQDVGLEKPDVEFFKLPLKQHTLDPKDAIFVGDNYFLDFIPSTTLGMKSVLLDENRKYPLVPLENKIYHVKDVLDILEEKVEK